jgi:hypothetical protein
MSETAPDSQEVRDLLSHAMLTRQESVQAVPGPWKTLTGYAEPDAAKRFQEQFSMPRVVPEGGSAAARKASDEISSIVDLERLLRLFSTPGILEWAMKMGI